MSGISFEFSLDCHKTSGGHFFLRFPRIPCEFNMIYWFVCRKLQAVGPRIGLPFLLGVPPHTSANRCHRENGRKTPQRQTQLACFKFKERKISAGGQNSASASALWKIQSKKMAKLENFICPMSVGRSSVLTPACFFWGFLLRSVVFATLGEILAVADRKRKLLCGARPPPPTWSFNWRPEPQCVDDFHWLWNLNALRKCFAFAAGRPGRHINYTRFLWSSLRLVCGRRHNQAAAALRFKLLPKTFACEPWHRPSGALFILSAVWRPRPNSVVGDPASHPERWQNSNPENGTPKWKF